MADTSAIAGTYSPEDVIVVLSNKKFTHTLGGYTSDTLVSVEYRIPAATLYIGADNTAGRVVRGNKAADITISLAQLSESNDVLSQLLVLDRQTRNNENLFSVLIKDTTGRSLYHGTQAFIGALPVSGFGSEVSERSWVISVTKLESHIGGNGLIVPDTQDVLSDIGYTVEERWRAD